MLDGRLARLVLRQPRQILNHTTLNQIQQPRQTQPIGQLQQIQTFLGANFRNLVRVDITHELVERVLGHTRKDNLCDFKRFVLNINTVVFMRLN